MNILFRAGENRWRSQVAQQAIWRGLVMAALAAKMVVTMAVAAPATNAPVFTKLYHGAAYYPELWPESDVDRDVVEMKKLGINVVRIAEFAWAKMEPDEGKISLAFFRRVMDKLQAAGIQVVLCTPTATPPIWLTYGHPERAFVDSEGHMMSHGARQHASYENDEVRHACLRIVAAMAKDLGQHPALVAWQIDNELKCHVAEDYSAAAVAHWHTWLQARYGTIERLNAAWGTEIWSERYQAFEQVPAPCRAPYLHNASLSTMYRLFNRERIGDFLNEQCETIRRSSSAPITHNANLGFSVNQEQDERCLDFAAFDDYPTAAHWDALVMSCDLYRGAKPGVPFWVMETSASHNGSLGDNNAAPHPPGFLTAEAVACYALGSQSFNYWLWRQQRTGCELPHSAVMSAWFAPSLGYEQVMAVEQARKQLEPLLLNSKPVPAEVALTWSDRGRAMLQTEALGTGYGTRVEYNALLHSWQRTLLDTGLNREGRFEGAELDGLKLLITPAMPAVDAKFLARLKPWIEAGGVWICAPPTGTRTPEHTVPTNAGLGLVDDFAGIETVFSYPVNATGDTGEAFGLKTALSGWCSALKPACADTKVIGTLKTLLTTQQLAWITERKVGQGLVVVLGAQPAGDAAGKMLHALVQHYAARARVTQHYQITPGTLLAPRQTAHGAALWIAVNMDGHGGQLELPQAATDAITGEKLPAGTITLPRYGWRAIRF